MTGGDSSGQAQFAREWNVAFAVVAVAAFALVASGYADAGLAVAGLCGAAVLARWRVTRHQGHGFYEH